ncbi:hypothetical protein J3P90_12145 [Pseudomonas sp. D3-10]
MAPMKKNPCTTAIRSGRLVLPLAMLVLGNHATLNGAALASSLTEQTAMWMTVGAQRFAITVADNAAAQRFVALSPLALEMSDLNRNEKYATLPQTLPATASRPGTIRNGDLMLYGKDTLVVFYKDFDSTYAYTHLGHVNDTSGLAQALGPGTVRVTFSHD